jgi:hypothetical protein
MPTPPAILSVSAGSSLTSNRGSALGLSASCRQSALTSPSGGNQIECAGCSRRRGGCARSPPEAVVDGVEVVHAGEGDDTIAAIAEAHREVIVVTAGNWPTGSERPTRGRRAELAARPARGVNVQAEGPWPDNGTPRQRRSPRQRGWKSRFRRSGTGSLWSSVSGHGTLTPTTCSPVSARRHRRPTTGSDRQRQR